MLLENTNLSPIGTDEFPCMGAHQMFHSYGNGEKPYCYAVKVGIRKTEGVSEMLVKIPLSEGQKNMARKLNIQLHRMYPATVAFTNLKIYRYKFPDKIVYTATADKFEIRED